MLLAGDELNNSQGGNNNTYCQNNEIGWVNWDKADDGLVNYVGDLAALRKKYNAISRAEFLTGKLNEHGNSDVTWFNVNGEVMTDDYWNDPNNKSMVVKFVAPSLATAKKVESSILVFINASHVSIEAQIPCRDQHHWKHVLNSAQDQSVDESDGILQLEPRSFYVFEGESIASKQ